jgi:hypothetical protein
MAKRGSVAAAQIPPQAVVLPSLAVPKTELQHSKRLSAADSGTPPS